MKHYYVKFDTTVSKQNIGFGFCNTKSAVAFRTKEEALEFVEARDYDLSCELITRKEAIKYAENFDGIPSSEKVVFSEKMSGEEKAIIVLDKEYEQRFKFL